MLGLGRCREDRTVVVAQQLHPMLEVAGVSQLAGHPEVGAEEGAGQLRNQLLGRVRPSAEAAVQLAVEACAVAAVVAIEPDDLLYTPDELGVRAKEAIPPSCGDGSKAAILNQMQIEENRLREFGRIYKETYDQDITLAEAREMAQRLLTLYDILRRPLPGDGRESSSPDSPAQTEP